MDNPEPTEPVIGTEEAPAWVIKPPVDENPENRKNQVPTTPTIPTKSKEPKKSKIKKYDTEFVEFYPNEGVNGNKLYLLTERNGNKHAIFLCPCGCKEETMLPVHGGVGYGWRLATHHDYTVSLMPSIQRHTPCKSHYTIEHNKVHWH